MPRVIDSRLTVVRSGLPLPAPAEGELVVSDDEVRRWVRDGRLLTRIGRYRVSRLVTERLSTSGRPMLMWALRLMARQCFIADCEGHDRRVTVGLLACWSEVGVSAGVVVEPSGWLEQWMLLM